MDKKTQLISTIKDWIELEKEIESVQATLKKLKKKKKNINDNLTNTMKENKLDCIDVNMGQIRYVKNKVKKVINHAYLLQVMEHHYNKEEADKICEYIQTHREVQLKEKILFKKDKISNNSKD